ncbi:MAG: DUF3179 domain-containing protein [Gammaproteobacteria bacterium]|nr:DUF3179 domain-containing protein [Gammaproteobacteria bacterium]
MKTISLEPLKFYTIFFIIISGLFVSQSVLAFSDYNGFDVSEPLINIDEIHHGGPAKDGIPALDHPKFISLKSAGYLHDDDRILGMTFNGVSKAYPIKILNYHEIVNDVFKATGGKNQPVVITYCPLCGSGMAYSATINGHNTTFGVSGLLYNSDVLLYDRETESLWSQLLSKAISGHQKGTELEMLALTHTSWKAWKKDHPESMVLSDKTGFNRDYSKTPYGDYDQSKALYFPVSQLNNEYHPKEYVIGLKLFEKTKAYPFAELSKIQSPYKDSFMGKELTIIFDAKNRTGKILDENNKEVPSVMTFWFAWMAFYPESIIFKR